MLSDVTWRDKGLTTIAVSFRRYGDESPFPLATATALRTAEGRTSAQVGRPLKKN